MSFSTYVCDFTELTWMAFQPHMYYFRCNRWRRIGWGCGWAHLASFHR